MFCLDSGIFQQYNSLLSRQQRQYFCHCHFVAAIYVSFTLVSTLSSTSTFSSSNFTIAIRTATTNHVSSYLTIAIRTDTTVHVKPAKMHHNTLIIALGLTLAARTSAAPLSELAPDMRPIFTSVGSAPASTATGMANVTAGKVPDHKHTPNCEHSHNATHTTTSRDAQTMTSGTRGTAKGYGHAAKASGNPSPYPDFNASAYSHPHAVSPHNHTGDYCNHPSHHNTTTTNATHDKMIHPRMLNASAGSLHNLTACHCVHPSHLNNGSHTHHAHEPHNTTDHPCTHHNGTAVPEHEHSYQKRTLTPSVDVTVCLAPDCSDTTVVSADLSSAGRLQGTHAKIGRQAAAKRLDMDVEYVDVARQMDGATIAGGI